MTYKDLLLVGAVAGCVAPLPPDRLVGVDAELSRSGANELAESQPQLVRTAKKHRDDAWSEMRRGDIAKAELHAHIAWQQLRVAENLEALALDRASQGATAPTPVQRAELPVVRAAAEVGDTPDPSAPAPVAPSPAVQAGASSDAEAEVYEAEDARLRLLGFGISDDPRFLEGQGLVEAAQRALDRGSPRRASALARRASVLFDVVRLTRGAIVSQPSGPPEKRPGATPRVELPEAGQPSAGWMPATNAHIAFLRRDARLAQRGARTPEDKARIDTLMSRAARAEKVGDLETARAQLLEASGRYQPVTTEETEATPPAPGDPKAKPKGVDGKVPPVAAAAVGGGARPIGTPAVAGASPAIVPVPVPIPVGGTPATPPAPTGATPTSAGPASPAGKAPVGAPKPRSRIVSSVSQPVDPPGP